MPENGNGRLLETTYHNGNENVSGNQTVAPKYDTLDRVTSMKYNGSVKYWWSYNNYGLVGYHKDGISGLEYRYGYDLAQRLSDVRISNGNNIL